MPYASVTEIYGEDFGKTNIYNISQNYGARNISDFNQTNVPDTALNMEVGTTNMDIVKFNQQQQHHQQQTNGVNELDEPNYRFGNSGQEMDSDAIVENFRSNRTNGQSHGNSLHSKFLEHFSQCPSCRTKVWEKFSTYIADKQQKNGGNDGDNSIDIREMFSQNDVLPSAEKKGVVSNINDDGNSGNNYVDIIVMILLGVFIIFVLDAFVKLGQSVGKRAE